MIIHRCFLFPLRPTKKFIKKLENYLSCVSHQSILANFEAKVEKTFKNESLSTNKSTIFGSLLRLVLVACCNPCCASLESAIGTPLPFFERGNVPTFPSPFQALGQWRASPLTESLEQFTSSPYPHSSLC